MGMYTALSILFLFLVYRVVERGPEPLAISYQPSALSETTK
jgi:hypothetical protein